MLSIIVFVNLFSRNKVLSFSFFINLFIIIFFGDDLIHYTLILFILSFCLFIFIISSNINYRYPILCKCLFPPLTLNIIVFLFFLKIFIKKKLFFFHRKRLSLLFFFFIYLLNFYYTLLNMCFKVLSGLRGTPKDLILKI